MKGFITSTALSNIYYLLRKTASHEKVIKHLQKLLQIVDVAVTDNAVALQATSADFKDFKDALQNFTAEKAGIKIIVTRNIKDYKASSLSVMAPENFLKLV